MKPTRITSGPKRKKQPKPPRPDKDPLIQESTDEEARKKRSDLAADSNNIEELILDPTPANKQKVSSPSTVMDLVNQSYPSSEQRMVEKTNSKKSFNYKNLACWSCAITICVQGREREWCIEGNEKVQIRRKLGIPCYPDCSKKEARYQDNTLRLAMMEDLALTLLRVQAIMFRKKVVLGDAWARNSVRFQSEKGGVHHITEQHDPDYSFEVMFSNWSAPEHGGSRTGLNCLMLICRGRKISPEWYRRFVVKDSKLYKGIVDTVGHNKMLTEGRQIAWLDNGFQRPEPSWAASYAPSPIETEFPPMDLVKFLFRTNNLKGYVDDGNMHYSPELPREATLSFATRDQLSEANQNKAADKIKRSLKQLVKKRSDAKAKTQKSKDGFFGMLSNWTGRA